MPIGQVLSSKQEKWKMDSENQSSACRIDLTPSWGQWGNIYARFAETGETAAVKELRKDFARAMAACQALQELGNTLSDEQKTVIASVMARELAVQGF